MLLHIEKKKSSELLQLIHAGDLYHKPGWIRLSVHPILSDAEVNFIMDAIEQTASNFQTWIQDYDYDPQRNEFFFKKTDKKEKNTSADWFNPSAWNIPSPVNGCLSYKISKSRAM
jgi:hypothetical protein